MRNDFAEIAVVIDESGSMKNLANDTIGGFNTFLEDQKACPGTARLTVVKFNTGYDKLYDGVELQSAKPLTAENYRPGGMTALYDAIGQAINAVGTRLANEPEDQRPGKVIVAILTDGEENSSKEFTQEKIAEMIKHQTEKYNWNFMFLAANQDAWKAGGSLGVTNCVNYAADSKGVADSYMKTSNYTRSVRISV
ncbi:MAG: vWA domain-containing protein [Lentisphaerota bacterium]